MLWEAFRNTVWASIGYTPHESQLLAHDRPEPYRLIVAGRRWGKSKEFAAKEIVVEAMMPDRTIWTAAPTYELASKIFNPVYMHLLHDLGLRPVRHSLYQQIIELPWGSTVQGKSTDNPDSCIGEGLDLLVMDEFARIPQRTWEESLEPTLLDSNGRWIGITTPQGPNHVKDLYDQGQSDDPDIWSLRSPTWENPYIPDENLERLAKRWGAGDLEVGKATAKWRQEIAAEFVIFEGLIYWVYRKEHHVQQPPPLASFNEFYAGVDWGFDNPFAYVLLGRVAQLWWVLRLIYGSGMVASEQRRRVAALHRELPKRVRRIYADPSRPDTIEEWRRAGFPIEGADNAVESGIEVVSDLFDADRLFLAEGETEPLQKEFGSYRRPNRKPTQRETESPLDRDNHACDGLRYGLVGALKLERGTVDIRDVLVGDKRLSYTGG
jgi:hypothetical protein